jgi:hypothetical protein
MGRNSRRLRVEPTGEWEQIELRCGWPEQRDYELIRTDREEVRVPERCFIHGDQENPPKLSQPIPGRCLHVEANKTLEET